MTVRVRLATVDDLDEIYELIAVYAQEGTLLPRSRESLRQSLSSLAVAVVEDRVAGVVALHRLEEKVAEVRSLAVRDTYQGRGIGQALVTFAVEMAESLGFHKVICFTRQTQFFARCGFQVISRETVPVKYFIDCVSCPKLLRCDETAMERTLVSAAWLPRTSAV